MKTNTMVLTRFNEPLVPEEIEIPALRPGEILIKLEASGICGSDVHMGCCHERRSSHGGR